MNTKYLHHVTREMYRELMYHYRKVARRIKDSHLTVRIYAEDASEPLCECKSLKEARASLERLYADGHIQLKVEMERRHLIRAITSLHISKAHFQHLKF